MRIYRREWICEGGRERGGAYCKAWSVRFGGAKVGVLCVFGV